MLQDLDQLGAVSSRRLPVNADGHEHDVDLRQVVRRRIFVRHVEDLRHMQRPGVVLDDGITLAQRDRRLLDNAMEMMEAHGELQAHAWWMCWRSDSRITCNCRRSNSASEYPLAPMPPSEMFCAANSSSLTSSNVASRAWHS